MAEWLKAHAWKACMAAMLSQVRILFSPPNKNIPIWVYFYLRRTDLNLRFCKAKVARFGVANEAKESTEGIFLSE
jgi:hypothetical protein